MNQSLDYVNVIRFDNDGFYTKPYNCSTLAYPTKHFCHSLPFLNIEVTDIDSSNLTLPRKTEITKPKIDDTVWSGCFAFLETFDPKLFDGPMSFRAGSKKKIALLPRDEKVWVRNINYKGETIFSTSEYSVLHEGREFYFKEVRDQYDWVLMTVEDALLRTQKGIEYFGHCPEKLSEIFLMENQVLNMVIGTEKPEVIGLQKSLMTLLISMHVLFKSIISKIF
ncbi:hypothetical protein [Psychrobacillus sp. FSL H8-0510]|uniref:hypothetical protein n=1 Tax=Psychrobacillus sp. FSL H8-0510 TaxID=2921394 RepID=UPI0030F73E5B